MKFKVLAACAAIASCVSASAAFATTTVGNFTSGSFLQSGTITNSSGLTLTGITIDLGVDSGAAGNGTPIWDINGGLYSGSPTGTFTNPISGDYFFTVSWLGLSIGDGSSFSYSNLDYDGLSSGGIFNAGGRTLLDGSEMITLFFDNGSSASANLPAGSPSGLNVDILGTMNVVPVPASLPLLAFGLGSLGLFVRRKRKDA